MRNMLKTGDLVVVDNNSGIVGWDAWTGIILRDKLRKNPNAREPKYYIIRGNSAIEIVSAYRVEKI